MSAIATEPVPQEALELRESTFALPTSAVEMPTWLQEAYSDEQRAKMVPLHIIRPGVGRGRGNHLYEAKMLEENADVFKGWKMYVDHLSPEARKKSHGLPRSFHDLGGRIVESYWDGTVPADAERGFGQGAVIGWAIPTPFVKQVIDNDPEIAEASISANATGVRAINRDGKRVWLVEGIEKRGSVDWVTEAGAGGRVVALMEAAYSEENEEDTALLESMTDEDFMAWVGQSRPHLLAEAEESETPEGDSTDNPAGAEGEDMGDITPEKLQEALQSEDFQGVVDSAVQERLRPLVEAAVSEERELIRAEARADADRQIELRDLRDEAHEIVEESRLPDPLKDQIKAEYALTDTGPTAALDAVTDQFGEDGKVEKQAKAVLREAVEARVSEQRDLLAAVNPTRVKGQGPATPSEGDEDRKKGEGTLWGELLQESGVDPETAYSLS